MGRSAFQSPLIKAGPREGNGCLCAGRRGREFTGTDISGRHTNAWALVGFREIFIRLAGFRWRECCIGFGQVFAYSFDGQLRNRNT